MSRFPEVKVQEYKGALVSLLLVSGKFKAEFRFAGTSISHESIVALREIVDRQIEEVETPGLEVIVFDHYSEPERVKLVGVKATGRAERSGVAEKAFLVEAAEGKQKFVHGVVPLADEVLALSEIHRVAKAEYGLASDAHNKARDAVRGYVEKNTVRVADAASLKAK